LWLIPNQDLQDQQAPPAAAADSAARRSPAGPSIPMRGRLPVRHVIPAAESRPSVPQSGGEATPQAAPQLRIASSSEPIPAFEPIADSVNASAVEQKSAPPHVSQEAEFRFAPPSLPGTVSQANELPYLFAAHSADRQGDYEDQPVKPANRSAAHSAPQPAARPAAQPVQPTFAAAQAPYISNPAYSNPASSNPALYSQAPYTPEPASSEPTADDLPYSAASRLGGLRNLLVSLGKQTESVVPKSDDQPRPDRNPERPVYAQPFTSVAQEIAGNGNTPNVVTARPEIILPSAQASQAQSDQAEHAQAGHERPEHKSEQHKSEQPRTVPPPRAKRTEPPDDIQTLPSQRGQYRRRRG